MAIRIITCPNPGCDKTIIESKWYGKTNIKCKYCGYEIYRNKLVNKGRNCEEK